MTYNYDKIKDRKALKNQWDEAAKAIAKTVVGIYPLMNEDGIRYRVYNFFVTEHDGNRAAYDDDNYYYTTDITNILKEAFENTEDDGAMAVTSDFRWAYEQLPENYRYRIQERYRYGVVRPGGSKERAELSNAVRKLADILNTWSSSYGHEGPGAREVLSNARAKVEVDWNYSGDGPAGWNEKGPFRFDGGAF